MPPAQAVQLRSVVAFPSLITDCPAAQSVRVAHAVAGSLSWSQVLPPQAAAGVVSPAQYSPGLHASHTGAVVLVPTALCTVPAAHMPWARHTERLAVAVYVPAAQPMHTRSTVSDGVLLTYVPAAQLCHTVQLAALFPVLKLPLAQPVHTRFALALPPVSSYWPGTHVAHAVQLGALSAVL